MENTSDRCFELDKYQGGLSSDHQCSIVGQASYPEFHLSESSASGTLRTVASCDT